MAGVLAFLLKYLPEILITIVILAVVGYLYHWADGNGYKRAEVKYQKAVAEVEAQLKAEQDTTANLRLALADLDRKYAASQQLIDQLSKLGGDVRASVSAAVREAERRGASAQQQANAYAARAGAPSTNTLEVQCENAFRVLGDLSDFMRQPRPAPSPSGGTRGQDTGAGVVRQ